MLSFLFSPSLASPLESQQSSAREAAVDVVPFHSSPGADTDPPQLSSSVLVGLLDHLTCCATGTLIHVWVLVLWPGGTSSSQEIWVRTSTSGMLGSRTWIQYRFDSCQVWRCPAVPSPSNVSPCPTQCPSSRYASTLASHHTKLALLGLDKCCL